MARTLFRGVIRYQMAGCHDLRPDGRVMAFDDRSSALRFLRVLIPDPFNMATMRGALADAGYHSNIERMEDQGILDQLALLITSGVILIIESPVDALVPPLRTIPLAAKKEAEPAPAPRPVKKPPPAAAKVPKKTWIEIELVGEDGKGIKNEDYLIVTADGKEYTGKTDRNGSVRLEEIPEGDCTVSFPSMDQDAWEEIEIG